MVWPIHVRCFGDYCASVNIIQKNTAAESNARRQVKSLNKAELQQGTLVLKMKIDFIFIFKTNVPLASSIIEFARLAACILRIFH